MRKSFLLSGILLASLVALRCGGGPTGDDDDGAGDGGESGAGKGGTTGGISGSAGKGSGAAGSNNAGSSSSTTGGASGSAGKGAGGDGATSGDAGAGATGGSGGSGDQGGTGGTGGTGGNSGEAGMAGEPGTGGTTGGTAGKGGTGGVGGKGGTAGMTTGGTAGKGGTGGTAGKGGSGGTAGKSCGTGVGLALTSETGSAGNTGWIEGDNNCVGVQGAVLIDKDLSGSTIDFTSTTGHICVAGHAEQVVAGDFTNDWGAMIRIQLNNPDTGAALSYNANTYGLDGFAFELTGSSVPPEVRTTLIVSGSATQYCKRVCDDGDQSILLSQAHAACWTGTAGATPSATTLQYLQFLIPAVESGDVTFDFCIDGLTAITDNVSVGDPGTCPDTGGTGGTGGMGGTGGSAGSGAGGSAGAGTGGTGPAPGYSCEGYCGYDAFYCFCDPDCLDFGDCCSDYLDVCTG